MAEEKKVKKAKRKRNTNTKHYINGRELREEIVACKKADKLSPKAIDMFQKLANRAANNMTYKDYRDREDCIQSALYDLSKYWRNFNPEVSSNAFAFFTQIAKHGYAKEWKKIHKNDVDSVSLDYTGDSEIYTM